MTEGQSARISDLDQNFCFEAQTTLASPWTSFEGFITLITAEKKEKRKRAQRRRKEREEKKEKRGREEKRNQGEFDRSLGQSSFSSSPLFHLPWIL